MKSKSLFSGFIFIIILVIGLVWARAEFNPANYAVSAIIACVFLVLALFISSAIKIADPWDKAVVLRSRSVSLTQRAWIVFHYSHPRYHTILD